MQVALAKEKIQFAYRFSQYFGIDKSQAELDFVDVLVDTDVRLYLDPFALSIEEDGWSIECNNVVVDFFQELLNSLRDGKEAQAKYLLSNLHEPNYTRLGQSRGIPRGRGFGAVQSARLYEAFAKSKAVKSGILSNLSECELFIEGVGYDKVSDMTTNIIRGHLIAFTQSECTKLGIPMENKPTGPMWRNDRKVWASRHDLLPVCNGRPVILVPKRSVRYQLALNDEDYYTNWITDFIRQDFNRAETLRPGSSLYLLLKTGKRVTKKDIKEIFPKSKDFLREVSEHYPELLDEYKKLAEKNTKRGANQLSDHEIRETVRQTAYKNGLVIFGDNNKLINYRVGGSNFGAMGDGNNVTIRDIHIYKSNVDESTLDPETKELLKRAIDEIEEARLTDEDKMDAKENLDKLTTELQAEKRPGIVGRCIERLAQVVPPVATILKGGSDIAQVLGQIPNPFAGE